MRSVGGFVRAARPGTVISDDEHGLAAHVQPGAKWYGPMFEDRANAVDEIAAGTVKRGLMEWHSTQVLIVVRPDDHYSPYAFYKEDGELVAWYINLQTPMVRHAIGYDYRDQLLDILVAPDLSWWQWKDEDEVARAVELGMYDQSWADEVRRNGEAVLELIEQGDCWWMHFAKWRPEPCPVASLPDGWDVV